MAPVGCEGQEASSPQGLGYGEPSGPVNEALGGGEHVEEPGEAPHGSGGRQVEGRSSHMIPPGVGKSLSPVEAVSQPRSFAS